MSRLGASDVLLYENPVSFMDNPRRRRRRSRRNPNIGKMFQKSFAGLNLLEMLAAVAGFAASAMIPGYILKPAAGGTLTTLQKAGKVGMSVAFAVVMKMALSQYKAGLGSAALYGGVAGAGALALKEFTTVQPINRARQLSSPVMNRLGPSAPSPAGMGRSAENEFATATTF